MNLTTQTTDSATRTALAALRRRLMAQGDYSPQAETAIIANLASGECMDTAPYVYDADVEALTEVYIEGFPVCYPDSPEWDADPTRWEPTEPDFPDAPDFAATTRPGYHEELERDGVRPWPPLPQISGGEDIPVPYEPTPEDWEDYRRHCEAMDALDDFNDSRLN